MSQACEIVIRGPVLFGKKNGQALTSPEVKVFPGRNGEPSNGYTSVRMPVSNGKPDDKMDGIDREGSTIWVEVKFRGKMDQEIVGGLAEKDVVMVRGRLTWTTKRKDDGQEVRYWSIERAELMYLPPRKEPPSQPKRSATPGSSRPRAVDPDSDSEDGY